MNRTQAEEPYAESARELQGARVKILRGHYAGEEGDVEAASRSGDVWVHLESHGSTPVVMHACRTSETPADGCPIQPPPFDGEHPLLYVRRLATWDGKCVRAGMVEHGGSRFLTKFRHEQVEKL